MSQKNKKLLIIGKTPPPIGGVTIHVKRLLHELTVHKIPYIFVELRFSNLLLIFKAIVDSRLVHLHSSNPYFRLLILFFCLLIGKKSIFTLHGNVGRYGVFKNFLDNLSIRFAEIPVLLNQNSYQQAFKINKNSRLFSAFIPPGNIEKLNESEINKIKDMRNLTNNIFCTNASNVSYDKDGQEIYQILTLIQIFDQLSKEGLIISDPSGNYLKLIKELDIRIPDNIFIISKTHDFNAVILESDCMIRFTLTDGDSLSVKEALLLRKPVIATDVVNRPEQVLLVSTDIQPLEDAIKNFQKYTPNPFNENGFKDLLSIYHF